MIINRQTDNISKANTTMPNKAQPMFRATARSILALLITLVLTFGLAVSVRATGITVNSTALML